MFFKVDKNYIKCENVYFIEQRGEEIGEYHFRVHYIANGSFDYINSEFFMTEYEMQKAVKFMFAHPVGIK